MTLTKEPTELSGRTSDITLVFVQLLANQYQLYLQTGSRLRFVQQNDPGGMHTYLEWQLQKLNELMQGVMERIDFKERGQAGIATGFVRLARLINEPDKEGETVATLGELLRGHTRLAEWLDECLAVSSNDGAHAVFLGRIREHHLFMAWMTKVFL